MLSLLPSNGCGGFAGWPVWKKKPKLPTPAMFPPRVEVRLILLLESACPLQGLMGLLASCPAPTSNRHFLNADSYRNLGFLGLLEPPQAMRRRFKAAPYRNLGFLGCLEAYCKVAGLLLHRLPDSPPCKPPTLRSGRWLVRVLPVSG